jgi:hypothetical protein
MPPAKITFVIGAKTLSKATGAGDPILECSENYPNDRAVSSTIFLKWNEFENFRLKFLKILQNNPVSPGKFHQIPAQRMGGAAHQRLHEGPQLALVQGPDHSLHRANP